MSAVKVVVEELVKDVIRLERNDESAFFKVCFLTEPPIFPPSPLQPLSLLNQNNPLQPPPLPPLLLTQRHRIVWSQFSNERPSVFTIKALCPRRERLSKGGDKGGDKMMVVKRWW